MMREKVRVDQDADGDAVERLRPAIHMQVEAPPRLTDIARDTGVHEAAIERHAEKLAVGIFRIRPRAHMDLVQFEPEPDCVEHEDDFELVPSLQFGGEHEHLC